METTKTIAKVVNVEPLDVVGGCCVVVRVELDCDVPGIVFTDGYYTKAPVNYIVVCEETSPSFRKGDLIEITSTFLEKGQEYNGHITKNACYFRSIKVLK